jgi:hypothetical protein
MITLIRNFLKLKNLSLSFIFYEIINSYSFTIYKIYAYDFYTYSS